MFLGLPIIRMVRRVVLLLLLQQQQDELNDDAPLTRSPYVGEGRRRGDRRVPRPALRHPRLSPWTSTRRQAMLLGQQATSCRQAAEWGMRGLQGSFPRLKDHIIYEENGERAIILKFITLLYKYRV